MRGCPQSRLQQHRKSSRVPSQRHPSWPRGTLKPSSPARSGSRRPGRVNGHSAPQSFVQPPAIRAAEGRAEEQPCSNSAHPAADRSDFPANLQRKSLLRQLIAQHPDEFERIIQGEGEDEEGGEDFQGQGQQPPPGSIMITPADEQAINRVRHGRVSCDSWDSARSSRPRPTSPATRTRTWLPTCCSTGWQTGTSRWSPRAAAVGQARAEVVLAGTVLSLPRTRTTTTCSTDGSG